MIMPESSGHEVRRLRFPRWWLAAGGYGLGVFVLLAVVAVVQGVLSLQVYERQATLTEENQALRVALKELDGRLAQVGATVERVEDYEHRLRSLTMVHDPSRNLAIGPVGTPGSESADPSHPAAEALRNALFMQGRPGESVALLDARLEHLEQQGETVQNGASDLAEYLKDQRARLASTPSRRPAPGYISSTFGMRVDPFTGSPQMHAGIDFATSLGSPVTAPADGTVVKARSKGAYGLTVQLDHGHGLTTLFGHMSRIHVEEGQTVRRGDLLGAVGNTGRSTGPHLHYEVRLNGIPVDPSRYILE